MEVLGDTIATLSNTDVSTAGTKTYDLISLGKTDVVKIKMAFTKDVGNLSIDDIAVTYTGVTNTPISGSPFTVTETTKTVTGLTANSDLLLCCSCQKWWRNFRQLQCDRRLYSH